MVFNEKEYRHNYFIKNRQKEYEWRHNNSKKINESQQKYVKVFKYEVLAHYSNALKPICVKCGFEDIRALSLDHINGGGKEHRKHFSSSLVLYRFLKKNNYPQGYQTLCMNCQFIKRFENNEFSFKEIDKRYKNYDEKQTRLLGLT